MPISSLEGWGAALLRTQRNQGYETAQLQTKLLPEHKVQQRKEQSPEEAPSVSIPTTQTTRCGLSSLTMKESLGANASWSYPKSLKKLSSDIRKGI